MKISIFGLGYVGAVSLACLARDGHDVIGVDVDPAKLDLIRGRQDAGRGGGHGRADGRGRRERPRPRDHATRARPCCDTELSLVCVGTPSAANGSQDQSAMLRLASRLGRAHARQSRHRTSSCSARRSCPGTVEDVLRPDHRARVGQEGRRRLPRSASSRSSCAKASSIRDYDKPPFTVVGAERRSAGRRAARSSSATCRASSIATSIRAAEMVKYCCNNFHALKITFANETARLCEALGVDPFEVMDLVCKDTPAQHLAGLPEARLRLRRLVPAEGPARDDLPRARCTTSSCRCSAASCRRTASTSSMRIAKVLATGKRRIGMIGLSFKTGTDDLRESPLVLLAEHFIGKGCRCSSTIPRCTCPTCSAPTGASSSSTSRTSAR